MIQKNCSSALLQEVTLRLWLLIFPQYYSYIDLSPTKEGTIRTESCEKFSEIVEVNVTGSKKYCFEKDTENSRANNQRSGGEVRHDTKRRLRDGQQNILKAEHYVNGDGCGDTSGNIECGVKSSEPGIKSGNMKVARTTMSTITQAAVQRVTWVAIETVTRATIHNAA